MAKSENQHKPFGTIRNLIWPIHHFELKKLLPMFVMFFLIAFVYNMLHCLKVPLIVKAEGSGAEVMPFLQIVAVLPIAVLLSFIYTKLISRFSREHVFYMFLVGFLLYFALFLFVLYPNHQSLQLDTIANFLQTHIFTGTGSKGLIAAIRHLNLTIFYVLCEMWSVVVLFMLFWGFANEVTKVEEAKRFYAIFSLGANCTGIISGEFARLIANIDFIPVIASYQGKEWLFMQLSTILVIGCLIIYLFWWLNKNIFHLDQSVPTITATDHKITKISLKECFTYLRQSRYLTYMVLIVIGYYVVYNLADIMWAYKIGLVMDTAKDINSYMNRVTSLTGIVSVVLALVVSGNVIRKFGWTIAALGTPIVWLLTSIGFFSGLAFESTVIFDVLATLMSNPANLVLFLGSMQICLGRSCKYTLFDETKEIAFIPLSKQDQRKGKVIVDGLASRFGKSGGSIIYVLLFYFVGEMALIIPYVAIIIFVALAAWVYATMKMGHMIEKSSREGITLTLETEKALRSKAKLVAT